MTGKASDHAMLADFLQKLGGESTIKGVKLLSTGATTVGATTMVDFKLAATMDSKWSKK
jgi:hypothetical protein